MWTPIEEAQDGLGLGRKLALACWRREPKSANSATTSLAARAEIGPGRRAKTVPPASLTGLEERVELFGLFREPMLTAPAAGSAQDRATSRQPAERLDENRLARDFAGT